VKVLLLGGTTEGRELTVALTGTGIEVIESVAGRTAEARNSGAQRIGGFGGVEGLTAYLRAGGVDAVVDATHPFATQMTVNAATACAATGTPLVRLARPSWAARDDAATWTWVPDHRAAAATVVQFGTPRGGRVLLTVGRQPLDAYRALPDVLARVAEVPDGWVAPRGWELRAQRGPFALEAELTLLRTERIDALVSKDAGGEASAAKLDAAAQLGIRVVMVARPQPPPHLIEVPTTAAVVEWLACVSAGHPCPTGRDRPRRRRP